MPTDEEFQAVGQLWVETRQPATTLGFGPYEPVFGRDTTWYFWDETQADYLGPFDSEDAGKAALEAYLVHLGGK